MTIALSVNLNKIALLRNARECGIPDLLETCRLCLAHGADGITVHPRPDQRHVRASDIAPLRAELAAASREFNMEGNPFSTARGSYPGFLPLVLAARPEQCTLVPDSDEQATSDHGWNLEKQGADLRPLIARLRDAGIRVSLFMDADPAQIALAAKAGADRIEIYTEPYAKAYAGGGSKGEKLHGALGHIRETARQAAEHGLGVNAGHDLNLNNLPLLAREIPQLEEVSIGHALTADALRFGFPGALEKYRAALQRTE